MTANQFLKQFADLMVGKRLMYVHGFASSAQSGTVQRLRQTFPNATIIAEDIPVDPVAGIDMLHALVEREQPHLIIGTSMGGMYAEQLHGVDRILVNPAFQIAATMKEHGLTGNQVFHNPRRDGQQQFLVNKQMVKAYHEVSQRCFAGVTPQEQQRVFALFGDKDDLVDTRSLFLQHYTQAIPFHGGHRMDDRSFMHSIVPVIRWIDDRQEGRERPVVYVHTDTLIDSWGKPTSSAQKSIRHLIETWNVYFVSPLSPAPGADWLAEWIGVPSWHHTILTHSPHLLYGDYLVCKAPCPDFPGTVVPWGSDTFKTWDEVVLFFDRLSGGQ